MGSGEGAEENRRRGAASGHAGGSAGPRGGAYDGKAPGQFLAGKSRRHTVVRVEFGGAGDGRGGNEKRTAGETKDHDS